MNLKRRAPDGLSLGKASVLSILEGAGLSTDVAVGIAERIAELGDADEEIFASCESPIERMFVSGFYRADDLWRRSAIPEYVECSANQIGFVEFTGPHECDDRGVPVESERYFMRVAPQVPVGVDGKHYTLDFLVAIYDMGGDTSFLAVELDGHEFHERTKEQVKSDNERDRSLLSRGLPTVRFSGSEVFSDPVGCAREVFEIGCRLVYHLYNKSPADNYWAELRGDFEPEESQEEELEPIEESEKIQEAAQ